MLKKNDPTLLIDRRFLMDILTEQAPASEEIYPEPLASDHVSQQEILFQSSKYDQYSHRLTSVFLNTCPSILPILSRKEFNDWALMGLTLLEASPEDTECVEHFFRSSPAVLSASSFSCLKGWAQQGEKIARRSLGAAAEYYHSTPEFLKYSDAYHIRKWADWAIQIMNHDAAGNDSVKSFFKGSIDHLKFMTFRELKDWKMLGLLLSRYSPKLGSTYFSKTAIDMDGLFWPERNIIYRLSSRLAEKYPEQALEFFMCSPKRLMDISPNARDIVLEITEKMTRQETDRILSEFDQLVSGLKGFPFPTQHHILKQGDLLAETSVAAARAYFKNAGAILSKTSEAFLDHFVEHGMSLLQHQEHHGIEFFSLICGEAEEALSKWANAVLLEDYHNILSMFAEALSGKELSIQDAGSIDPNKKSFSRYYPTTDGSTIYLPPFITGGETKRKNFSEYKAATAHQAGFVEYGSFDGGLPQIVHILNSFPIKDLAIDIFFILEDQRIDLMLKRDYRGLEEDLNGAVSKAMGQRDTPAELPLQEALVEILLRLTLDRFDETDAKALPTDYTKHIKVLKNMLSGFYKTARNVWDSFSKTLEIYGHLSLLYNIPPHLFDGAAHDGGNMDDSRPYHPSAPLFFRGRIESGILPDPAEIEVLSIEPADGPSGMPLSLEELQQLIENLDNPIDILNAIDGKDLSAPGLFIKDLGNMAWKVNAPDSSANEHQNHRQSTAAVSLPSDIDGPFYYDEWDYIQGAYRKRWCRLTEQAVSPVKSGLIDEIYATHRDLIDKVKKQFQRIRPEIQEIIPRVDWGDEIDLSALIQAVVDKKAGSNPSDKIFTRKEKRIRKIAALFLIDMSASTGNPVPCPAGPPNGFQEGVIDQRHLAQNEKNIIDIEIESLVVIMEALEALNDDYAIFGFSGYGRDRVDFYMIKDFDDHYSEQLKMRISGINPKQSTRMGPAIRHAVGKLEALETEQRILILLSDGFPQDCDYGEDRTSHEYGLHDTMMALLEAKNQGVRPFCITVDQSGNDYLKKMCDPSSYLVIQNILSLPEILPMVVESLIT